MISPIILLGQQKWFPLSRLFLDDKIIAQSQTMICDQNVIKIPEKHFCDLTE